MNLVSVIIPAYNAENYIGKCLNSILSQTYRNIEILVVDDGSSDKTKLIVERYQHNYENIYLKSITNHGQGYARNFALNLINGKYVMFMDADDFIEKTTIEDSVNKIEMDNSDFVVFDWKYFHHNKNKIIYNHFDNIFSEKILKENKILKLFEISVYFTVNKLYRTEFLIKNNIRYMENYIYEDVPFWVQVVINAKKVSLINKPLYNVRINATSTTKVNYHTDFHYKSFIKAIEKSFEYTKKSRYNDNELYALYKYYLKKFQVYRDKRTPKNLKKDFTKEFLKQMSQTNLTCNMPNKLMKYSYKYKIFKKEKYKLFNLLILLKDEKIKYRKKFRMIKKRLKVSLFKKQKNYLNKSNYQSLLIEKEKGMKIILFMGFDYKYTGNSRYLFEKFLKKCPENIKLYFVTDDYSVDEQYRVTPKSDFFKFIFNNSDIIIFESWIPLGFIKRKNVVWIQLWHGTPLKKLLFDSNEKEITKIRKKHKINKFKDILRWNYLIVDNINVQNYFTSAFQIDSKKILPLGYPRVEFLLNNNNNKQKDLIRKKYNIEKNKKLVVYMPTWRDYNYGKDNIDSSYILNIKELSEKLSDDYIVIFKDHTFLNSDNKFLNLETQELLLIADFLITDYSSVMFDAFAINLKTVIYSNDFEKYQKSRGVYENIWEDLKDITVNNVDDVCKLIKKYDKDKVLNYLKKKYSYNNYYKKDLTDLIIQFFNKTTYNPFLKKRLYVINQNIDLKKLYFEIEKSKNDGFLVLLASLDKKCYFDYNANWVINIKNKKEVDKLVETYHIYEVIDLTKEM